MNPSGTAFLALPVFVQGLASSFGLIVAIGGQNAFVLRQGSRRAHLGSVVLFCAVADAVLIAAGVMGMAQTVGQSPSLVRALALAGAAFLAAYGWQFDALGEPFVNPRLVQGAVQGQAHHRGLGPGRGPGASRQAKG